MEVRVCVCVCVSIKFALIVKWKEQNEQKHTAVQS